MIIESDSEQRLHKHIRDHVLQPMANRNQLTFQSRRPKQFVVEFTRSYLLRSLLQLMIREANFEPTGNETVKYMNEKLKHTDREYLLGRPGIREGDEAYLDTYMLEFTGEIEKYPTYPEYKPPPGHVDRVMYEYLHS